MAVANPVKDLEKQIEAYDLCIAECDKALADFSISDDDEAHMQKLKAAAIAEKAQAQEQLALICSTQPDEVLVDDNGKAYVDNGLGYAEPDIANAQCADGPAVNLKTDEGKKLRKPRRDPNKVVPGHKEVHTSTGATILVVAGPNPPPGGYPPMGNTEDCYDSAVALAESLGIDQTACFTHWGAISTECQEKGLPSSEAIRILKERLRDMAAELEEIDNPIRRVMVHGVTNQEDASAVILWLDSKESELKKRAEAFKTAKSRLDRSIKFIEEFLMPAVFAWAKPQIDSKTKDKFVDVEGGRIKCSTLPGQWKLKDKEAFETWAGGLSTPKRKEWDVETKTILQYNLNDIKKKLKAQADDITQEVPPGWEWEEGKDNYTVS